MAFPIDLGVARIASMASGDARVPRRLSSFCLDTRPRDHVAILPVDQVKPRACAGTHRGRQGLNRQREILGRGVDLQVADELRRP